MGELPSRRCGGGSCEPPSPGQQAPLEGLVGRPPERKKRGSPQAEDVPQQHPLAPFAVEGFGPHAGVVRPLPRTQAAARCLPGVRHLREASSSRRLSPMSEPQRRPLSGAVAAAVARVLDVNPALLRWDTPLADLGADDVALVLIADVLIDEGHLNAADIASALPQVVTFGELSAAVSTAASVASSSAGGGQP